MTLSSGVLAIARWASASACSVFLLPALQIHGGQRHVNNARNSRETVVLGDTDRAAQSGDGLIVLGVAGVAATEKKLQRRLKARSSGVRKRRQDLINPINQLACLVVTPTQDGIKRCRE